MASLSSLILESAARRERGVYRTSTDAFPRGLIRTARPDPPPAAAVKPRRPALDPLTACAVPVGPYAARFFPQVLIGVLTLFAVLVPSTACVLCSAVPATTEGAQWLSSRPTTPSGQFLLSYCAQFLRNERAPHLVFDHSLFAIHVLCHPFSCFVPPLYFRATVFSLRPFFRATIVFIALLFFRTIFFLSCSRPFFHVPLFLLNAPPCLKCHPLLFLPPCFSAPPISRMIIYHHIHVAL